VRRQLLADGEFLRQPVLLERLAEAERRLGDRVVAIERLAALCWCFCEQAEALLDADGFPDGGVRAAWQSYRDLDLEPPVESAWFPAWLLLCEPRGSPRPGRRRPRTKRARRAEVSMHSRGWSRGRLRIGRKSRCAGSSRDHIPASSRCFCNGRRVAAIE
jgi:hypothetical protein